MGNLSKKSWQDVYYDGILNDPMSEMFCEETKKVKKRNRNNKYDNINEIGWNTYEREESVLREKMRRIEDI